MARFSTPVKNGAFLAQEFAVTLHDLPELSIKCYKYPLVKKGIQLNDSGTLV